MRDALDELMGVPATPDDQIPPGTPTAEAAQHHTTEPQPILCPHCGSDDSWKYGVRNGVQRFKCAKCKRVFDQRNAPSGHTVAADRIGLAIGMYYDGMSLSAVSERLRRDFEISVNPSTVYRWVQKFTPYAVELFGDVQATVTDVWVADETALKVSGIQHWHWDVIDEGTRFLLASQITRDRSAGAAAQLFKMARAHATTRPQKVLTDGLKSYMRGVQVGLGLPVTKHIVTTPFAGDESTALIERFHGTLKARTNVMRGLKSLESAAVLLDGFRVHYNFFRRHLSLGNRTPAEAADLVYNCENWTGIVSSQQQRSS